LKKYILCYLRIQTHFQRTLNAVDLNREYSCQFSSSIGIISPYIAQFPHRIALMISGKGFLQHSLSEHQESLVGIPSTVPFPQ